ncbi:hypothetical protein Exig_1355 [Exiguobacterium sibiricum 255-15]|uniref:GNAT family N-acetyltransferase n=1 Tax=Exiguobacterium sibiricum (strain DSM 17290 / CCUG 55495 / CIP 109462 / JCM 13490 / 255-15) TaxID=262543 RepID=B1YFF1_EXIS2|nr:hypothetical protein [Exiguobacterium sibiricum]ACB60827.1 hypothetical protein Exig_1355 [Exiguobacterium sibiricum 255-15]
MKFFRTTRTPELSWIPEQEWQTVCAKRSIHIQQHPNEQLVGLAYNNQQQIVQVTRNIHVPLFSYYVTLLENRHTHKTVLSKRSHMTIQHLSSRLYGSSEFAEFSLLDIHVREEGLGERGLLLESLIHDIQHQYTHYRVSGDFTAISYDGRVSAECFTRYGFTIEQDRLILKNFHDRLFVS